MTAAGGILAQGCRQGRAIGHGLGKPGGEHVLEDRGVSRQFHGRLLILSDTTYHKTERKSMVRQKKNGGNGPDDSAATFPGTITRSSGARNVCSSGLKLNPAAMPRSMGSSCGTTPSPRR
eukprot:TRINITY_DN942_c0_g1_i4.p3 TRINITY_DN942_c0_g1~~TRINITY_DN942_c0_g1_i4.p3  ORF type:complete len:120 (+),score=9.84 TRINITY_DN942_c0_g1_i4:512-871(+)